MKALAAPFIIASVLVVCERVAQYMGWPWSWQLVFTIGFVALAWFAYACSMIWVHAITDWHAKGQKEEDRPPMGFISLNFIGAPFLLVYSGYLLRSWVGG